jgi:hypothetical protein
MGTGYKDIGKYTRGAAEYVVFQFHALIDGNVVLDAHAVAYFHVVANVDILPERAVLAYYGSALYVAEVPYLSAVAYGDVVVDVTGWMNCIHNNYA